LNRGSIKLIAAIGSIAALLGGSTSAQANDITATTRGIIYRPTTLASLLDLDFGTIVASTTGGQVQLDAPGSTRNCDPALVCLGGYNFATLILTGSDAIVQVTYAPTVQLLGPGAPMNVALQFPGGSGALVPIVSNIAIIKFGALLDVNPNQLDGTYSATFSVNVDYP
jgi:Domain of unknown function (DUF4402)